MDGEVDSGARPLRAEPEAPRDLVGEDLPAVGALFAAHTGRPAHLDTLAGWIDSAPSAASVRGGKLVGYVVCRPFAPDLVELASFLVAPGWRDRGIGRSLVAHVEARAAASGHRGIVVVSSDGYATVGPKRSSRGLFERLGYRAIMETDLTVVLGRTWGAP